MKKQVLVILIAVIGLSFFIPDPSSAWTGGGGYRSGFGYRPRGIFYYGPKVYVGPMYGAPVFVSPHVYRYPPPVVYVNPGPPPLYVDPGPEAAYPDPALPPGSYADPNGSGIYANPDLLSAGQYAGDNPPGEWVTIPGQWVNNKWIPPHNTWVPVNP